jgi:flagella basal body P-ring formation protein FlgA
MKNNKMSDTKTIEVVIPAKAGIQRKPSLRLKEFLHLDSRLRGNDNVESGNDNQQRESNKKTAIFAAYLMIAMPYNMAMAADWQTPRMLAEAPQASNSSPASVITTDASGNRFYQITADDVAREVANQLQLQGVEKKATATVTLTEGKIIHSADHPLQLVLHGLQVDPASSRWQAQANILSNHKTEMVKPVGGFYEAIVSVPMLVHQVGRTDVIEQKDITMRDVSARQLRKDTITDAQALIGKSPRAQISANRSVRLSEISAPVVIRRGELVEMNYSTPYMQIKTTGIALDDGELGGLLRVKNTKTEKAISTRVIGTGKVQANLEFSS